MGDKKFAAWLQRQKSGESVPNDGETEGNALTRFLRAANNPTSAADTFQNRVMQSVTFGGMDNLSSAIDAGVKAPFSDRTFGEIYNENQAQEQNLMQEQGEKHPIISGTGAVAGALIGPDPVAKVKVPSVIGKSILSGAVNSGLQAFGEEDEGGIVERLKASVDGFVGGGVLGAGTGAIGSQVNKVLDRRATAKLQKSLDAMHDATNAGYQAALSTGEVIPGTTAQKHLLRAVSDIRNSAGYRGTLKEKEGIEALMDDIYKLTGGSTLADIDLATMDKIQQEAWTTYHDSKPGTKRQVVTLIKALDNAMDDAAANGSALLKTARAYSRMERNTKMFDEVMEDATFGAESGAGDYASAYKSAARRILKSKKHSQFLNEEETAALKSIIDGKTSGNVARYIGRFAPNSGSLASLISMMSLYHNPYVGVPAMVGAGVAKKVSERSTANLVEEARRVFSGSPQATPSDLPVGPTMAKAAGQTAGPQMPSIMDMLLPGQSPSTSLVKMLHDEKLKQQGAGQ